jgi:hypothetical protein
MIARAERFVVVSSASKLRLLPCAKRVAVAQNSLRFPNFSKSSRTGILQVHSKADTQLFRTFIFFDEVHSINPATRFAESQ